MHEARLKPPMDPGPNRVRRGGSWFYTADYARAASRGRGSPGSRGVNLGLRLVCDTNHEGEDNVQDSRT